VQRNFGLLKKILPALSKAVEKTYVIAENFPICANAGVLGVCILPFLAFPCWRAMDKYNVGIVGLARPGKRYAEETQQSGAGHLYAAWEVHKE
jgi:hypothetical protein